MIRAHHQKIAALNSSLKLKRGAEKEMKMGTDSRERGRGMWSHQPLVGGYCSTISMLWRSSAISLAEGMWPLDRIWDQQLERVLVRREGWHGALGRQSGMTQCWSFGLCYSTEFWIVVEVADATCNFQISRGHVSRGLWTQRRIKP